MTTDRASAARYAVRRMWDITFVMGVGFFIVSLCFASDAAAIANVFLAFNAGVLLCTWFDRILFDNLRGMCGHLARVCDEQQATINALRQHIEGRQ